MYTLSLVQLVLIIFLFTFIGAVIGVAALALVGINDEDGDDTLPDFQPTPTGQKER